MKKWSRRKFLEKGVVGAIAAGGVKFPQVMGRDVVKLPSMDAKPGGPDWRLLNVVMDVMIPKNEGMPSASEAGCFQYLDQLSARDPVVTRELDGILAKLEALSLKLAKQSFTQSSSEQRTRLLAIFEQRDRQSFEILRNYVYEAYYTQPKIWDLIGYEPHPTNEPGPTIAFDETVLAAVRKKPRYYREV